LIKRGCGRCGYLAFVVVVIVAEGRSAVVLKEKEYCCQQEGFGRSVRWIRKG
jgi:hypothetical protein